ncbi:MAG: tripartite tricarboxylate transporter permease [Rhodospirillales bacterium]|nr:tripartite tricarboxylate transporter permease [Rhodospirillales bacterium]
MIEHLPEAMSLAFSWHALLAVLAGSVVGVVVGVLPGLGSALGLVMVLPITFGLEPAAAIAVLVSVYACSIYGGSVSAILINVPGTPQSAATVIDGYPMAQQGKAALALGWATVGSFIGGMFSLVLLVLTAPQLAKFSLNFGPIETFALILFAMTTIAWVSHGSMVKGVLASLIGVFLGLVGPDQMTGQIRFDFDFFALSGGFALVPVLIGIFAMSEVLIQAAFLKDASAPTVIEGGFKLAPWHEWCIRWKTFLRSSVIGSFIGILPGTGATAAAFIAYADAKRNSPRTGNFGHGEPEGVVASETANNAVSGGAMIPMLALGIPGDGVTAIMMGALTIHGIVPGVRLFSDQPALVTSIFLLFFLANFLILIVGAAGAGLYARLLRAPMSLLMPAVALLSFVGAYATRSAPFDFTVAIVAGVVGFLLRLNGFPLAPIIIGFILGRPLEMSLRQGLVMTDQNFFAFALSPIAAVLFALTVVVLLHPVITKCISALRGNGSDSAKEMN